MSSCHAAEPGDARMTLGPVRTSGHRSRRWAIFLHGNGGVASLCGIAPTAMPVTTTLRSSATLQDGAIVGRDGSPAPANQAGATNGLHTGDDIEGERLPHALD